MRFFEKLNRPIAVLVVSLPLLVLDTYLLYRYQWTVANSYQHINGNMRNNLEETNTTLVQDSTAAEESAASTVQEEEGDQMLRMVVTVVDNPSWLVIEEDGQVVFARNSDPGFSQEFEASKEISVSSGNAGAVEVEVNGQYLGVLGESGEVLSRTFTL